MVSSREPDGPLSRCSFDDEHIDADAGSIDRVDDGDCDWCCWAVLASHGLGLSKARVEHRATRIAQTLPAGPSGARRSPSPVVNAATGADAQEQQGSSQPSIEQADGRTATLSLVLSSRLASCAVPEMPHGRCTLAMAIELLRYRPAPDRHND
ncbi:hypothetical protein D1007_12394 [Hordeum vulgare]|nr:hypothetical protein D1007_12394 [Hordeum vulgare]